MNKLLKMSALLSLSTLLCSCFNSDNSTTSTQNVMMGNAFTVTATLTGSYQTQSISATTNESGATITPTSCTVTAPATQCSFTILTYWNTALPNSSTHAYTVNFASSGSGLLTNTSIDYNVITPTVYLAQTGTIPTTETLITGVPWPNERFTEDNGPECLKDNLTGLVWMQTPSSGPGGDWQDAEDYVATLNAGAGTCGYTDWRLPTINELVYLANYAEDDPQGPATWLDDNGFSGVSSPATGYWSATKFVPETPDPDEHHWFIDMENGHVGYDIDPSFGRAWAVRGGE